jgi:hypothetical protein
MNPSTTKIVLSEELLSSRKTKPAPSFKDFGLIIDETLYNNYLPALLFQLD